MCGLARVVRLLAFDDCCVRDGHRYVYGGDMCGYSRGGSRSGGGNVDHVEFVVDVIGISGVVVCGVWSVRRGSSLGASH